MSTFGNLSTCATNLFSTPSCHDIEEKSGRCRCDFLVSRAENLVRAPTSIVFCAIDIIFGLEAAIVALGSLGLSTDRVNRAARHLYALNDLCSKPYEFLLKVLDPKVSFTPSALQQNAVEEDGPQSDITRAIESIPFAGRLGGFARTKSQSENIFVRHVVSRGVYAATALAAVITRLAFAVFVVPAVLVSFESLGGHAWINWFASTALKAPGVINDVVMCAIKCINPWAGEDALESLTTEEDTPGDLELGSEPPSSHTSDSESEEISSSSDSAPPSPSIPSIQVTAPDSTRDCDGKGFPPLVEDSALQEATKLCQEAAALEGNADREEEMIALYEKAAGKEGYAEAEFLLGLVYWNKAEQSAVSGQANAWYRKAVILFLHANHEGHTIGPDYCAKAAYYYGQCVERGLAAQSVDLKRAERCYLRAADAGFLQAQARLGLMASSQERRVKYLKLAARRDHVESMCLLGTCYAHGRGVKKDFRAAKRWLQAAVEQKYAKAEQWLKWVDLELASAQGNAKASKSLEDIYRNGREELGISQDLPHADALHKEVEHGDGE